jgi:uncharacterized damage-inducible protein DinB
MSRHAWALQSLVLIDFVASKIGSKRNFAPRLLCDRFPFLMRSCVRTSQGNAPRPAGSQRCIRDGQSQLLTIAHRPLPARPMFYLQHLQRLTRYKAWADHVFLQSLAALPEAVLADHQPIVFGSMLRTLHHVYCMDQVWKAHLEGVPHGFKTRNPDDCPPFETLRAAQESIDGWYVQYAQSLDETSLNETVHFTFIGGGEGAMSRGDILMHVINHTTYHRGHVATMMYNASAYPPTTDLPVFLRETGG